MALFRTKFVCILAISNPIFRWESCKGSVWENVKKCSRLCSKAGTRRWLLRVARGLQAARRCTRVKHAEKLNHHASCSTTGQKVQTSHSVSSRLRLTTGSRGWLMTSKPPEDATKWSMQRSWTVMPVVALQDKKSKLAIQLARSLNSRLIQVARPASSVLKNWLFAFHSHTSINTPLYPQNVESF